MISPAISIVKAEYTEHLRSIAVAAVPLDGFAQGHAHGGLRKAKFSHSLSWIKELAAARQAHLVRGNDMPWPHVIGASINLAKAGVHCPTLDSRLRGNDVLWRARLWESGGPAGHRTSIHATRSDSKTVRAPR